MRTSTHLPKKAVGESAATDLTVAQVAVDLGLHYDTVRRLLIAGHLAGYKADLKQWRVTRAALDQFKASGGVRPVGRPRAGGNQ